MLQFPITSIKLATPVNTLKAGMWIYSNQVVHLADAQLSKERCAIVYIPQINKYGLYCKSALMSVRLLPTKLNKFFKNATTISAQDLSCIFAQELQIHFNQKRTFFGYTTQDAFRWIHGDADGFPGFIIDYYASIVVIQSRNNVSDFLLDVITNALCSVTPLPILEKSTGQTRSLDGLPERIKWIRENPNEQNGIVATKFANLSIQFAPEHAQKTGLFLDQRHNLQWLVNYAQSTNWQPKNILDICCYAGAWSAANASIGACNFTQIDADKRALAMAKINTEQNLCSPISSSTITPICGDMFEVLQNLKNQKLTYDCVIADPPAFAKSQKHLPEALRAYARLAKLAASVVAPQGLLVMCSCSRHVSDSDFLATISKSLNAEDWILLHRGEQSPCHTHSVNAIGSDYLKCYFFRLRSNC